MRRTIIQKIHYNLGICKNSHHHIKRAENSLQGLAFNFIDFDNNQIFKDKNKLEIVNHLMDNVTK